MGGERSLMDEVLVLVLVDMRMGVEVLRLLVLLLPAEATVVVRLKRVRCSPWTRELMDKFMFLMLDEGSRGVVVVLVVMVVDGALCLVSVGEGAVGLIEDVECCLEEDREEGFMREDEECLSLLLWFRHEFFLVWVLC